MLANKLKWIRGVDSKLQLYVKEPAHNPNYVYYSNSKAYAALSKIHTFYDEPGFAKGFHFAGKAIKQLNYSYEATDIEDTDNA